MVLALFAAVCHLSSPTLDSRDRLELLARGGIRWVSECNIMRLPSPGSYFLMGNRLLPNHYPG